VSSTLALWVVILAVATACTSGAQQGGTPKPKSTNAATATAPTRLPGLYPKGTHVGEAPVDVFLDLFYARDSVAASRLAIFVDLPCRDRTFGSPACGGQPEGTIRSVFRTALCQPDFIFSQSMLEELVSGFWSGFSLYAVVEPDDSGALGKYGLVLREAAVSADVVFWLDQAGRFVSITGCGIPGGRFLLPPRQP
jgi:hypothetical protein